MRIPRRRGPLPQWPAAVRKGRRDVCGPADGGESGTDEGFDLPESVHTGLAVFGCLLGFTKISDEMQDPDLKRLAERIGRVEGLPVVTDPGILSPEQFLSEVLTLRIPNPFMPDTPRRIATDTSQKLGVRFSETVKAYLNEGRPVSDLKAIP